MEEIMVTEGGGARKRLRKKVGDKKKPAKSIKTKSKGKLRPTSTGILGNMGGLKGTGKRQKRKGGVRRDKNYTRNKCTGASVKRR